MTTAVTTRAPTPEQLAAVNAAGPRRTIIAHAGTGKTFTLVEIIEQMLNVRRREPECITVTTFTRLAAREIMERSVARSGGRAYGITFGTSHALGLKIVRSRVRQLGFPGVVTIYDEQDQMDVLKDIRDVLKLKATQKGMLKAIEQLRAGTVADPNEVHARVAVEYTARLKRAGAIDMDGILPLALSVLTEDLTAREEWQRRARYMIVDEAQDTSPDEWALFQALAPEEMTVVGDPNQNIYAWRGTSVDFLDRCSREADQTIYLTQSFRSCAAVVDAANNLIRNNPNQPAESLRAVPGKDGRVTYWLASSTAGATAMLGQYAREALEAGSVALLSRTNAELDEAMASLRAHGVPVRELTSSHSFFKLPEVRAFHAWLRCCANPFDQVATGMVLQTWAGAPVANSTALFEARRAANATDTALLACLGWPMLQQPTELLPLVDAVGIEVGTHYGRYALHTRAENVDRAAEKVRAWAANADEPTLSEYVDWLQRRELADLIRARADAPAAIEAGTIHAAKGLEWDTVIAVGVHDGHFPHPRSDRLDERRLGYVLATRARTHLILLGDGEKGARSSFEPEYRGTTSGDVT